MYRNLQKVLKSFTDFLVTHLQVESSKEVFHEKDKWTNIGEFCWFLEMKVTKGEMINKTLINQKPTTKSFRPVYVQCYNMEMPNLILQVMRKKIT